MNAEYVVKDNSVLRISIELTFEEIVKSLSEENGRGKYGFLERVQIIIADRLATEFLNHHTLDIISKIDPQQIANMAALNVLQNLKGR